MIYLYKAGKSWKGLYFAFLLVTAAHQTNVTIALLRLLLFINILQVNYKIIIVNNNTRANSPTGNEMKRTTNLHHWQGWCSHVVYNSLLINMLIYIDINIGIISHGWWQKQNQSLWQVVSSVLCFFYQGSKAGKQGDDKGWVHKVPEEEINSTK